jgi:uncharacterized delta-60 repeat protein
MRRCFTFVFAIALVGCAHADVQPVARPQNDATQSPAHADANDKSRDEHSKNRAGALDESFGTGGIVVTDFAPTFSESEADAVASQSGGRIVAGGRFGGVAGVARYTSGGTLDKTFGTRGIVRVARAVVSDLVVSSLIVQPDDKILACATGKSGRVLARYLSDGKPDASFGRGGSIAESGATTVAVIVLQSDGKIVEAYGGGARSQFALVRYLPNGARDASFGKNGMVATRVGSAQSVVNAIVIQPDGKIVAAGTTYEGGDANSSSVASPSKQHVALARFMSDGRLDASFGKAGIVSDESDDALGNVAAVALQADGKIIVAGSGDFANALRRYLPDGTFETTLGRGGPVAMPERGVSLEGFNALAIERDGKIVAAGAARSGSTYYFVVARYLSDGRIDGGFGANGAVLMKADGGEGARALTLQPDGKIVVAGTSRHQFMLARYLP